MLTDDWTEERIAEAVEGMTPAEKQEFFALIKPQLGDYQYEPAAYIREQLGWEPWGGSDGHPGQLEIIDAYTLALRQQHERDAFQQGEISEADLVWWQPGQVIKNQIRLEAGHTVGKTKLASGLVSHFFDCFVPSIIYTYAPTWEQVHDLLWKEIKSDRKDKGLTGRVLETCEIKTEEAAHFAKGRATNDAGGKGTERAQGQHGKYLMFVLDEAEGVADFVYNAVDSMKSGGISIVLMLANPRTRSSRFHKARLLAPVQSFRMSCIWHPNVLAGREIVPGAVRRDYVRDMIEKHCQIVAEHSEDDHTFELPFEVTVGDTFYAPGTIYKPNAEFLFRVLGIAPANLADNALITVGRYDAACQRVTPIAVDPKRARIGVDVARFGKDAGTAYISFAGCVWRSRQFWQLDSNDYFASIKQDALELPASVVSLHIRVDGGGGFGSGVIDKLKIDHDLITRFPDFEVIEVHFNGSAHDQASYLDIATEMYAETAESLKGICVIDPPETLEADLCERLYGWRNLAGVAVKKLESKDEFRKPTRVGRSPDDGDGFVLAVAPDFCFPCGNWAEALKGTPDADPGTLSEAAHAADTW